MENTVSHGISNTSAGRYYSPLIRNKMGQMIYQANEDTRSFSVARTIAKVATFGISIPLVSLFAIETYARHTEIKYCSTSLGIGSRDIKPSEGELANRLCYNRGTISNTIESNDMFGFSYPLVKGFIAAGFLVSYHVLYKAYSYFNSKAEEDAKKLKDLINLAMSQNLLNYENLETVNCIVPIDKDTICPLSGTKLQDVTDKIMVAGIMMSHRAVMVELQRNPLNDELTGDILIHSLLTNSYTVPEGYTSRY